MTEADNINKFFTEPLKSGSVEFQRKDILSVSKISRMAGMPTTKLNDFVNPNKKYINIDTHIDVLVDILVLFGYKPVDSDNQFL